MAVTRGFGAHGLGRNFTVSDAGPATTTIDGDQFYVTHCTTADSVLNAPGYSVRATSNPADTDSLRLALEYPTYELPIEMWKDRPTKALAPRRLARTEHPESGLWVAHCVYLEKDTMGRDRSYFSHLLHLHAAIDTKSVLRSWDAPGWVKDYRTGATQNLPPGQLPVGSAISDETLQAFLAGTPTGPSDVATVVCPARLRTNPAARRQLVVQFLQALLLAERDRSRDQVFVHAEPGLVAMLLYAAVRLLPLPGMNDLTFSTYEPAHKGIRDYRSARVIGTYFGIPERGLDLDLVQIHGYGLDTLVPERVSPELMQPAPPGLVELIELAAAGEWNLLAEVQRQIGTEATALGRVANTIPVARAIDRLERGESTVQDLLALQSQPRGQAVLNERQDEVWAVIRSAALSDARVRTAFQNWLATPARLEEYRKEGARALVRGDLALWDTNWELMRDVTTLAEARTQIEKAIANLERYLPALVPEARERLRSVCAETEAWPGYQLLAPSCLEELETLLQSDLPANWRGYTAFLVMAPETKNWLSESSHPFRAAMRSQVRSYLHTAPVPVLAAYAEHAKPYLANDPGLVYELLQPHEPATAPFLSRFIDAAADRIEPADWIGLLGKFDIYGVKAKEWDGFLFQNDHLAKLLVGFKANPTAREFWGNYLELLSPEMLDEDTWERNLYSQLKNAKEALGHAGIPLKSVLPSGGIAKLNAADTVLAVTADPAQVKRLEPGELLKAFEAFAIDPVEGLRKVYRQGKFHTLALPRDAKHLQPFLDVFRSCYPVTKEYFTARSAVTQWLAISESCPDATRCAFQTMFVREYIPSEWHRDILNESRRLVFHPDAEAQIREGLAAPTRKPSGERAGKASASASLTENEDAPFASTATRQAKKSKSGGRPSTSSRKSNADNPWIWVVVIVAAVVALGLGAYVWYSKSRTSTKPAAAVPAFLASANPASA